jgi:RNA polymerase sigma-70 factor (ECF subfamily)
MPTRKEQTDLELVEELEDPGASPPQQAQAATDRAQLERCLDQLEARRRALIRAAFFEGCTYEELATRLAAPLGSIKSWIRRGLLQLRECLGP